MDSEISRRKLIKISIVTAPVGVSGCLQKGPSTSTPTESNTSSSEDTAKKAESAESVKNQAINAEEDYIFDQLQNASCAVGAPGGQTGTKYAKIVNETDQGKYVDVNVPYHYSTEELEADYESKALYLINETSIKRIKGDEISPC